MPSFQITQAIKDGVLTIPAHDEHGTSFARMDKSVLEYICGHTLTDAEAIAVVNRHIGDGLKPVVDQAFRRNGGKFTLALTDTGRECGTIDILMDDAVSSRTRIDARSLLWIAAKAHFGG